MNKIIGYRSNTARCTQKVVSYQSFDKNIPDNNSFDKNIPDADSKKIIQRHFKVKKKTCVEIT